MDLCSEFRSIQVKGTIWGPKVLLSDLQMIVLGSGVVAEAKEAQQVPRMLGGAEDAQSTSKSAVVMFYHEDKVDILLSGLL